MAPLRPASTPHDRHAPNSAPGVAFISAFSLLSCLHGDAIFAVVLCDINFVVQGHRFDGIEQHQHGCCPTMYPSVLAVVLIWIPFLILGIVALIFAAFALRHFILRCLSFAAPLSVYHSAFILSRYLCLILMSALQMVSALAFTDFWFTLAISTLRLYVSWAYVHAGFSRVTYYQRLPSRPP
ncbi:pheromone A receptor-domain-containing protein [Mycena galopus ATCC 62051]|nr:pheromone A receptor-domain-containing protein [Mycena galopus ATCC 62051]